jgi:hypothetical protein
MGVPEIGTKNWNSQPSRFGTAGSGGHVHKVLEAARHLALGGLVKVDGYVHQEEAGYEVVNVQA